MTRIDALTPIRPQNVGFESAHHGDMVWIPGGTFRMGSEKHYAEEAPVHRVTVDAFWIDRAPVTNRQFREFARATGYVTFAEVAPDPKDYPGALPNMLRAGSLIFNPPHPVDTRDWSQWWTFKFGANWRRPYGPRSSISGHNDYPVVHVTYSDALAYAKWKSKDLPTEAEWEFSGIVPGSTLRSVHLSIQGSCPGYRQSRAAVNRPSLPTPRRKRGSRREV